MTPDARELHRVITASVHELLETASLSSTWTGRALAVATVPPTTPRAVERVNPRRETDMGSVYKHAREVMALVVFLSLCGFAGLPSSAQERPPLTFESWENGSSRVFMYFIELQKALAGMVRTGELVNKCGYKKEADELAERVNLLTGQELERLVQADIRDNKLRATSEALVARMSTMDSWFGFRMGVRFALSETTHLLPARVYESVCKIGLQVTREWLQEKPR